MPSETEIHEALLLQQALRAIFESSKGGSNDRAAVNRVRALCTEVARATQDLHCRDNVVQLESYADALFSNRKHQQWARRSASGVLVLRHKAYAALDSLERRLHYLLAVRRLQDRTNAPATTVVSGSTATSDRSHPPLRED